MKVFRIILLSIILIGIIGCESPTEPDADENAFVIIMYSIKVGTKDTPYPNAPFVLYINNNDYIIRGNTDENGFYKLEITNKKYEYYPYELGLNATYTGIIEFGKKVEYRSYY